jgi:N4-(beta-N-acetylglucosaminyl)-L-asparaginase
MHPRDAGMDALRRVKENTVDEYLLNARGNPNFGLNFYILNAAGEHAGVSMYPSEYAICNENGAQTLPTESLLEGQEG